MQMEEVPQEVAEPRLMYLTLLTMLGCQARPGQAVKPFQLDARIVTLMKSRGGVAARHLHPDLDLCLAGTHSDTGGSSR